MTLSLDCLGIVVADIEKSVSFYELLGVARPTDMEGPHVESTLPNGLRLMWDSIELIREIDPTWEEPVGHRMGIGFHCGTPQGVDEAYAKVVAAGHVGKREPWDAFWGQRYAQVSDPDGNLVDLFAPLC
ncbi:MAG: VOC family protein [Armatimonadetes bacterium]|nr:VOC family protein [Armatimonadota bacterium]